MIDLSKKLFYATEAVLYIAYNSASERVSSRDIAKTNGLTPRYLEQIMQKLVRAKILKGMRGPSGGYLLAREKRRISIYDISKAIEDNEKFEATTPLGKEIIFPLVNLFRDSLNKLMLETTIADLYEKAEANNIKKSIDEKNDFNI
ncbi:MAG: Rrf2 family transcriptional regulator [Pseudomonadota bacterium]